MNTMFSIFASLSMVLFGGTAAQPVPANQVQAAVEQTPVYEIVKGPYSDEVTKAVQSVREKGGQTVVQDGTNTYLVIGAGQRSTGGYSLILDKIEKTVDGTLLVKVHEQKPKAGTMTTQVISYPTMVIAFPEMTSAPKYQVVME